MSYTIDHGYTRPVTTINLAIPSFVKSNWAERPTTDLGNESTKQITKEFVYNEGPNDRLAVLRKWVKPVDNIYAKLAKLISVNSIFQAPAKNGEVMGCDIYACDKVTDSVNNGIVYLPWHIGLQIDVSLHEAIDATEIKAKLCDAVDQMFPTGTVSANQIALQARGAFDFLDERG